MAAVEGVAMAMHMVGCSTKVDPFHSPRKASAHLHPQSVLVDSDGATMEDRIPVSVDSHTTTVVHLEDSHSRTAYHHPLPVGVVVVVGGATMEEVATKEDTSTMARLEN